MNNDLIPSPDFRSGFVSILGRPNVGKSTLLNAILGQKISIVSKKPQTTRRKIVGIFNGNDSQIVFIDTPGVMQPKYKLQHKMLEYINSAVRDSDVILVVMDCMKFDSQNNDVIDKVLDIVKNTPVILALNKVDLLPNMNEALTIIGQLSKNKIFTEIVPLSALKNENTSELVKCIKNYLPVHPPYFDDESISDAPTRFFISEIIREKIFNRYYDELPYSSEVVVDEYKERKNSKDYISISIIVERDSQKGIIIGKNGAALKSLGEMARKEIESFIGKGAYLKILVKVKENWRNDEKELKSFGY